ncbi:MAG: hypothetical protein WD355_01560 [Balneolaceae bacterium]
MSNRKNILYELEISCTILKTSINALASEWGVSHTHVRDVAKGKNQSARIRKMILATIEKAQKIVSFHTNT